MRVIADLCVVPLGVGVSVSKYVAACERVIADAGLTATLHAYGTNIEGEWDDVFAAIKKCHETIHAMGAPRISTTTAGMLVQNTVMASHFQRLRPLRAMRKAVRKQIAT